MLRLRSQQHLRAHPARRAAVQEGLRGRFCAGLPRHPSAGARACAGDSQGRVRLAGRFLRPGAGRAGRRVLAGGRQGRAGARARARRLPHRRQSRPQRRAVGVPFPCPYLRRPADEPSHGQHAASGATKRAARNDRPPRADRGRTCRSRWPPSEAHGRRVRGRATTPRARGSARCASPAATAPPWPAPCCCRLWSELQKVPGVVLVAGSGPTDRDGNNPLAPERIDLLKRIAELLAAARHRHAALRQARHRRARRPGRTARSRSRNGSSPGTISWVTSPPRTASW